MRGFIVFVGYIYLQKEITNNEIKEDLMKEDSNMRSEHGRTMSVVTCIIKCISGGSEKEIP